MLYIACVVYNITINNVKSIDQFKTLVAEHNNVKLTVLDNSTEEEIVRNNEMLSSKSQMIYIQNGGNIGLSRAYNKVLDITDVDDWIMWSDDDTYFSKEYLDLLYKMVCLDEDLLMAGIIKTNKNTILSPISRKVENGKIRANARFKNLYCINSGLCVKRVIYDQVGHYDEGFFIDMIDYWLFDELHKNSLDNILILPGEIHQEFSGTINQPLASKLKRFRIYAKDFNHYCDIEKRKLSYRGWILIKRLARIIICTFKG